MDPTTIALLMSAAINMYGQNRAANKQEDAIRQAQMRQLSMQDQATDSVMKRVQEFDPNTRNQDQQTIAKDLSSQYENAGSQPITAQGVEVGKTISGGGTDYLAAKAKEQAKTAESLRNLAQLMGRTGSASQLRQNEAVRFGDTAGEIGRIQTGANNMAGIDQLKIAQAGRQSLGSQVLASALAAYGASGGGAAGSTARQYGTAPGSQQTSMLAAQDGNWLRR